MKKKIRNFILENVIFREIYFFLYGKKVYKKIIDKKISSLDQHVFNEKKILQDVIISLTSYGSRLSELHYTIYSLVNQTVRPEKILINLTSRDIKELPAAMYCFKQYGVEFVEVDDIKSYKKLIPILQKYPYKNIVTADDDLFYPKNWLEELWKAHIQNPTDIVCHITRKIEFENKKIKPYKNWSYNKVEKKPSFSNLILSGAGAWFPPHSLYKDVCNSDIFMQLSPTADDIWDYFMAILKGTKILQIQNSCSNLKYTNPYREYGICKGEKLGTINIDEGYNDKQFKAILEYYNISEEKYISYISGVTTTLI